ncbi:hypothetical protein [Yoonia sp. R2-816]|uniref:hypothetical protein n=1 Tax=Yoonia sp. R2-816 TaxID=3342638 RepID=UPI00372AD9F0
MRYYFPGSNWVDVLRGECVNMCVHFDMKAFPSLRLKTTNIRNEFDLFLAAQAVCQLIICIRHGALMKTTALAVTSFVLTLGLGVSAAQADMAMNPNETQVTTSAGDETFYGSSGFEYHGGKRLLSAERKTVHFVSSLFSLKSGRAFEASGEQQLLTKNGFVLDRGDEAVVHRYSFGWLRALGELDPAKIMRIGGGNIFAVASIPTEKDTILVEVGRRRGIDGVLFGDVGYYSEIRDQVVQSEGFSISTSFDF